MWTLAFWVTGILSFAMAGFWVALLAVSACVALEMLSEWVMKDEVPLHML